MNALIHLLNSPFSPADNFPFSLSITFSLRRHTCASPPPPPGIVFRGKQGTRKEQGSYDVTSASILTVHEQDVLFFAHTSRSRDIEIIVT